MPNLFVDYVMEAFGDELPIEDLAMEGIIDKLQEKRAARAEKKEANAAAKAALTEEFQNAGKVMAAVKKALPEHGCELDKTEEAKHLLAQTLLDYNKGQGRGKRRGSSEMKSAGGYPVIITTNNESGKITTYTYAVRKDGGVVIDVLSAAGYGKVKG